jgi:predicted anti-sigma-YlaC factor YlaD
MNCRRAQEWIESYIVGDIPSELAERLTEHLKQCPVCRSQYEEQRRLIALLRHLFATRRRFA